MLVQAKKITWVESRTLLPSSGSWVILKTVIESSGMALNFSAVNNRKWSGVRWRTAAAVTPARVTLSSDANSDGVSPATMMPNDIASEVFHGCAISILAWKMAKMFWTLLNEWLPSSPIPFAFSSLGCKTCGITYLAELQELKNIGFAAIAYYLVSIDKTLSIEILNYSAHGWLI